MYPFQIGDRVEAIVDFPADNTKIKRAMRGTICDFADGCNPPIGIRWDEHINGHHCNGHCEYGYGWYVFDYEICLCEETEDNLMYVAEDEEIHTMLEF